MGRRKNNISGFGLSSGALDGKSILVTGGTGSFGRALVNELLVNHKTRRIVVFSRDEDKQHTMSLDLESAEILDHSVVRFFIGDVRDRERLEMAMRGIDIVVHAAAMKHVPIAEYNPFECIHTNVIGAENVTKASISSGVQKVIALSTDKACAPLNLYGASKLASDKIFVSANALSGKSGCHFSVVRYGNVLGSRGSVARLFKKLIVEGAKSLPLTDARMTRFFITISEGVNFVLSSLQMMQGGELFVPKIPSLKITDLARVMAPQTPMNEVGIRPGEKLHEVMITQDDARSVVELDDRYVVLPQSYRFWDAERYKQYPSTIVPEGFEYNSETNPQWLSDDDIALMLSQI